ncbi:DUF1203 domain-containing protein [Chryseobacterium daecheongense]|uniref:DUF1203 domain-containing protein n=1 Tax=Chryseobacterium daecheongense TaxID=192389 RepID=A0A3N0VZF8_9FLAO|nr:DUF1203 domain-containing protein [Chryseobacterium daecheongense]
MIVDKFHGFPCRVSLQDSKLGEEIVILPYFHHETHSPCKASGAYICEKTCKNSMFNWDLILPKKQPKKRAHFAQIPLRHYGHHFDKPQAVHFH